MDVVNEHGRQQHAKSMTHDKDHKHLVLLGRKSYSLTSLHFKITNYQALMAKDNHVNYTKLTSIIDHLPAEHREHFQVIVEEGQLLARTIFQDTVMLILLSIQLLQQ